MTRFLTIIVALLASASINASEVKNVKSIGQNQSVNECIKKYKSNNIECLDDIIDKSESLLNKTYNDKLNEIKKSDLNTVWMGDEKQKEYAIGLFIENQKKWIDYRGNYCTVALWKVQNSQHLGENQTSCKLNMNKRRIEEINLIGFE
ncbi:lysozyme inhibitor LprI family protein [Enterobacter sp. Bisph1]|uniref:lysozyme inhibitor LprI family protein n=1 Tax=Enterobacter sp. Bisph1 TaxID=1274399 RepID=UPI00057C18F2|nr:lysozyme inhibitor LprI family protein [Enterobacter sp. Bisph1]